jgi:hypothetical protein
VCFLLVWAFIGGMIFRDCQRGAKEGQLHEHAWPAVKRSRRQVA